MKLITPKGTTIVGTADSVLATAIITGPRRNEAGEIEFDYVGESDVDWNTQETRTDANGETLYTDDRGEDWPESSLKLVEDDEAASDLPFGGQ
jgi:hypothetical protein